MDPIFIFALDMGISGATWASICARVTVFLFRAVLDNQVKYALTHCLNCNNLGYAHYSTLFNFAKATLGTIPFVYFGSQLGGASGVLIGQAIGSSITGLLAIFACFYLLGKTV